MFSTDFIVRQQENLVDNQICQAGFRPLYIKILKLLCNINCTGLWLNNLQDSKNATQLENIIDK